MGDAVDSTAGTPASASEDASVPGSNAATPGSETAEVPPSENRAPTAATVVRANADTTKARPSGLKPPTKIGRLCAHTAPKPAVPVSPRTADGSSTETLRKYSDDYSRKHLADLVEADEEAESYGALVDRAGRQHRKASTSSTYSVTSMDALWERHPRKLSEAGLRRSSDHSVVLTEDTDSFIIGDRVWVGGGKPGQIAYIGETQFAPGEWAGIVLDDPIGKNDGSVAGVRYFQCSERRGVFSRLTRLTRAPLYTPRSPHATSPVSDAGSVFASPASATPGSGSGAGARQRRTLSPNGSVRSAISSKMNMSVTSTANGGELRLGERVIVSSSQGSKAGTLRYTGPTDFAAGVWCGVELDDPIGKNDGSVEGKRYFECSPRFGLFAPASKVSRSPSNRKPGACAIHSNGRSLRRSNSRESLTSLGTSIASSVRTASRLGVRPGVTTLGSAQRASASGPRASSTPVSAKNALQELLREKQHHLERLMRERELERAEVAKVTLQVERVQTQLSHAVKHSTVAASENEALKAELLKVNKQLEDERQRVEDLLFRTEEDNIHKEDYNKFKEAAEEERAASHKLIQELEAEVALLAATTETARASVAAASDKHSAELDTLATQHKEEIHAAQMLSAELQKLLDEAYSLLKEKENEKDSIGKSMTEELSKARVESEKSLSEAKSKLAVAQTEFEAQMSVLNAKLQMSETKLETEKQNAERLARDNSQTIAELNTKMTQTQAALDDKTQELNKVLGLNKEQELSLSKEITKLKMELSAKISDLEQLTESNKKYETSSKFLESEITNLKEDFTKKMNEYESLLNETSQQNDKYSVEVLELQQKLTMKTNEIEKILNESKDSSAATTKLVKEYKDTISERDKEIVKLKHDYEEVTANFNKSHSIIAEEHKKLIEERDLQIEKLTKEIDNHQRIIEKNKIDFDALTLKADNSDDEIKNLINKNNQLNEIINELNKTINDLNTKMSTIELQNGEMERQLNSSNEKCSELQKAKEKIETEYMNLTSHSTNSNDEISKLSQYLRETEKELQELRDKFREKSNDNERIEQELNQQMTKLNLDFTSEKENSNKTLVKVQEELRAAERKVIELEEQIIVLKDQYNKQEFSHVTAVNEKTILEKELEAVKVQETVLQSQLQDLNSKSEKTIEEFKHKIDILKADGETSEVKLKEKVDQLVEAQNDLNNRLEQAQKNEEFLQRKLEEVSYQFNNEKLILNQEINKKELELSKIKEEIHKSASVNAHVNASIQEKDNIIKDLNLKLAMLEVDVKSNIDVIAEKERQVSVSTQELSKIKEEKQLVEQKFTATNSELNNLQKIHESLVTKKNDIDITLKEHQEKVDQLLRDINALTQEKSSITQQNEQLSEAFAMINTEHRDLLEQIEKNNLSKTELSVLAQEKDNLIKVKTEKLLEVAAQVQALQVDNDNMHKELTERSMAIEERNKQISQLQESLKVCNSDSNLQVETLKKDIENINNKHKTDVEYLQNNLKHLETSSNENEINLELLNKKDVEILELQGLLTKAEADIKQLTNINDGQKANYEDLNKHLQADYDQLKKDSKKERHALKEKLEEFKKSVEESKTKMNIEVRKQSELQSRLDESEKRALELANKVELLTVHQKNTSTEQDQLLEKITLELQGVRKSTADTITSHELMINKLKIDVENKINDLLKKDDQIAKLEEELKNQRVKTELAQREKHLIQQESAVKEKDNICNKNYSKKDGQGDENTLKLVEEKELVEGQVEFLNSVIVDMQRKNEQLLARVHALETGFSPDTATDNTFHFESKREVAPRLFCDICDVFDAHDTEDCPRQAGERTPSPATTAPGTARKPPPPPRPYCDICEVFGHATENCDEEETF